LILTLSHLIFFVNFHDLNLLLFEALHIDFQAADFKTILLILFGGKY